jgi:hypothetical protein
VIISLLDINKNYFTEKGSKILLNTHRCEIYVPDSYLETKMLGQDGEIFDLLFIVKYRLFHTDTDDASKLPIYEFHFPSMVLTKPDEVRHDTMDIYGVKEKVTVLIYHRGGEIIYNCNIIKSSLMVERFVTLLINGKIRGSYVNSNNMLNDIQKIHNTKLNVPQYVQHILLSEVYRSRKDLSQPARIVASPLDKDDSKIRGLNMRENAAYTSTLAGVGFEDVKSMLTVADNRDDKNDKTMNSIELAIRGLRPPKANPVV